MNVAKLILTYNNHDLTRGLLKVYPEAIVIDNGSESPVDYTENVIRSETNLGFTKGWNFAIRYLLKNSDYDAFVLMNNDIAFQRWELEKVIKIAEEKPRLGIVSASCNSPHALMIQQTPNWLRYTPFVEFVAPLIKREVFENIGLFNEVFEKGWGVEYDYCYRVRRGGYSVGVYDLASFKHFEHKTIDQIGRDKYFKEANHEMEANLTELYGPNWKEDLTSMIGLTMVVCNEGHRLKDHLEFHKNLVDEITVVVQESKDNTLELAYKYADTVIEKPCVGYCEAHRIDASRFTNSDWQLCLDADEFLTEEFIQNMRSLMKSDKYFGYRLTRRLIVDGEFRFEGDAHHRFYHRKNVKFLDELHTEPQSLNWNKVSGLPYIAILHIKSTKEIMEDELRCELLLDTVLKNDPLRDRKKALNIHLRDKEKNGT